MTLAMGLFDGTLKSFGTKLESAFKARASIRRKVAEKDPSNAASHRLIAEVLDDVAEVIHNVAEL